MLSMLVVIGIKHCKMHSSPIKRIGCAAVGILFEATRQSRSASKRIIDIEVPLKRSKAPHAVLKRMNLMIAGNRRHCGLHQNRC